MLTKDIHPITLFSVSEEATQLKQGKTTPIQKSIHLQIKSLKKKRKESVTSLRHNIKKCLENLSASINLVYSFSVAC